MGRPSVGQGVLLIRAPVTDAWPVLALPVLACPVRRDTGAVPSDVPGDRGLLGLAGRALPRLLLAGRQRLWLPAQAPWLDEMVGELLAFPNGQHDDQVDTLAYAAREMLGASPGAVAAPPPLERVGRVADLADPLALGPAMDYETVDW